MSDLVAVVAVQDKVDTGEKSAAGIAVALPPLVPVEPDAVEWCMTFWRQMQDRLRRQAREHEVRAQHLDGVAAGLSLWATRDLPWTHAARTAARLDAVTARAAATVCRDGAAFARGALKELTRAIDPAASAPAGSDRWDDDGGAQAAQPVGPFYVSADILARADTATERDGAWTLGPKLPLEGLNEIRITDAGRMAVRRADLGFPPVYELAGPDHADAGDAGLHSRYFRLDVAGDWPSIIETTQETRAMLARRNADRRAALKADGDHHRSIILGAETMEPVDYLKDKADPLSGGKLVTSFWRTGNSGTVRHDLLDARGERGMPKIEVRTPLQLLRNAHRIDPGQYAAGDVFAERFADAQFNLGRGTDYSKIRGSAGAAEKVVGTEVEEQRRWVFSFLDALGGAASPAAMAVWCVAGAQMPLDAFAVSRHFRMPGGQRWLTPKEAEGVLSQGLAMLRAHLDAPSLEFQRRRYGLKIRMEGAVELSFLVGSRRFKVVGRYAPDLKFWIADRMAPRRNPAPGKAAEFRHWSARAATIPELIEVSITIATEYLRTMTADAARKKAVLAAMNSETLPEKSDITKLENRDDFGLTVFH